MKGGYSFKRLAGTPKLILRNAKTPSKVVITLRQGFGEEVKPIVKVGDKVKSGQIIGIDDSSLSSPVHATVNGTIEDICPIKIPQGDTNGIIIVSNGTENDHITIDEEIKDYREADSDDINKMLYLSGFTSLGQYGFPTKYNTSAFDQIKIENLIINAVYSEPYSLRNQILFENNLNKIVIGLDILRKSLNYKANIHIAINARDRSIIESISNNDWLNVVPLKAKYPQDHDILLAQAVLDKNISYSKTILELNTIVLDIQAVIHAYQAVIERKPIIERIISLGGTGLKDNLFLKVRIGTLLKDIIEPLLNSKDYRIIYGGLMTGKTCSDMSIPVDRTASAIAVINENRERQFLFFLRPGINRGSFSNAFLSFLFPFVTRKVDTNLNGEYRPCIYCNYCESVCPSRLMPYLLSKYSVYNMIDDAERLSPLDCIECGLCTFVCPSKIPVMSHIKELKKKLQDS
ncbi:MAG: 4Fe-4S dicluster domain-containing protein [bacterium]